MKKEILLTCPYCTTEFIVEIYDSGNCPNCKKMHYYWDYVLDEKTYEELLSGFYWEPITEKI